MAESKTLNRAEHAVIEVTNLDAMCLMIFEINPAYGLDSAYRIIMDEEIEEKWMEYLCRVDEMEAFFKLQRPILRKDQPALRMWRNYHIVQITNALSEYMVAIGLAIQLRTDEELTFEPFKPAPETVDRYLRKIRLKVED